MDTKEKGNGKWMFHLHGCSLEALEQSIPCSLQFGSRVSWKVIEMFCHLREDKLCQESIQINNLSIFKLILKICRFLKFSVQFIAKLTRVRSCFSSSLHHFRESTIIIWRQRDIQELYTTSFYRLGQNGTSICVGDNCAARTGTIMVVKLKLHIVVVQLR